jgi:predicted nucleotidyltransferase
MEDHLKENPDTWETRLGIDTDRLATLCCALGVRRLALFGSVLTDRFGPESDVDLLVEFKVGAIETLLDRGRAQMEFEALFGRTVDLTELRLVDHPTRYKEIESSAVEIFAE